MFFLQLGTLAGFNHLFVLGRYLFFNLKKICHSCDVPSGTCPRKSRWNLQESGNPNLQKHQTPRLKASFLLKWIWMCVVCSPFCSHRCFTTLKVIQVRCSADFDMFICYTHRWLDLSFVCHSSLHLHFIKFYVDFLLPAYRVLDFCSLLCVYYWMFVLKDDQLWLLRETIDGMYFCAEVKYPDRVTGNDLVF